MSCSFSRFRDIRVFALGATQEVHPNDIFKELATLVGMKQVKISVIAPNKNAVAPAGMIDALVLTRTVIEVSN